MRAAIEAHRRAVLARLSICHLEMLLRVNKWPLWSRGGGGGLLESNETLVELFVSALIRRIRSSWYRVLRVCVRGGFDREAEIWCMSSRSELVAVEV